KKVERYYPHMPLDRVKAYIYDIKDKNNITQIREVEIEGHYVTSRKIGSSLYMISNSYMGYDILYDENIPIGPKYKDSYTNSNFKQIPYEDIKYIPPIMYPRYLVVASLDLDSKEEVEVKTYLGASDNVYVSQENIYVTVDTGVYRIMPMMETEDAVVFNPQDYEPKTKIYKFSMDEGKTTYIAKGEVPGNILNQFSMDEHKKSFRIATTRHTQINNRYTSTNNVYILNENMNVTGKLEDLAPEERIYSVRFMGDKGYMVTFKDVDPLFVLDLEDPSNPRVLGKLKIPGYSDYLHPYDENHLIGFGKDTVALSIKDWQGNETGINAYYMGMKIALFDVSDVNNPIEKHKIIIGDRGTESELLRDHKALLFDKKRNLLGFPITVCEVKGKLIDERYGIPAYGEVTFQGAYIYELTPEDGFDLKGKISHVTQEDDLKSGYYYGAERTIRRLLYIGDYLYGVSNEKISAHDMDTLKEENSITIK
ncbi:MAG: beta-propeller domain-containing protein, partial [Clostridia bacterium]|nr:beta-propeller domain-containing protein [Clostridia bacterium]